MQKTPGGRTARAHTRANPSTRARTHTPKMRRASAIKYGEMQHAGVLVQDVRVWGEETHTLFDASSARLDVQEAWFRYQASDTMRATVGRQEIGLHEQRLIGVTDWAQQGRSFDGVRLEGSDGLVNAEVIGVLLGDGSEVIPQVPTKTYTARTH